MFGPPTPPPPPGPFFSGGPRAQWATGDKPMIRLQAGDLACELEPRLGGCIAGLWLGDVPVLRSTPAAQLASAREAGSYPLVPFSNRIAQATLVWDGTQ